MHVRFYQNGYNQFENKPKIIIFHFFLNNGELGEKMALSEIKRQTENCWMGKFIIICQKSLIEIIKIDLI